MNKHSVLFCVALLLQACGGGSSGDSGVSQPPVDTLPDNAPTQEVISAQLGEVVSLAVIANNTISDIQWQQTAGPAVTLLSDTSKVVAFEIPDSGNYRFTVTYQQNGRTQSEERQINASADVKQFTLRLDHAVRMGNNVSMRATADSGITVTELRWQQIYGPRVTLDTESTTMAAFFDAPSVANDTLVAFRVTAIDDDNNSYTDDIWLVVENAQAISNDALFDSRVATVFAYNDDSPFKQDLLRCIYNNQIKESCQLGDMPLIAASSDDPDLETIMDRVLVSHRWMGDRFKQYLQAYDQSQEFKRLLRATTAIVIAYDIRPSFYQPANGAIYLDPENLWLTPEERDTINEAPDFRAGFGNDLKFIMPWRYVKDNQYAYLSYPRSERISRTLADINYRFASLLFHELAHANDFFSYEYWASADPNSKFWNAVSNRRSNWPSTLLMNNYPLTSIEMDELAEVSFQGQTASEAQKAYLPADVSQFFSPDRASDYYNYNTQYEDLAMLFEELMMHHRFGVRRDVAVTTIFTDDNQNNDYIVNWGQRGRIAEPALEDRVKYAVSRLLPEVDIDQAYQDLPAPLFMQPGLDWWDNLVLEDNRAATTQSRPADNEQQKPKQMPRQELIRYH